MLLKGTKLGPTMTRLGHSTGPICAQTNPRHKNIHMHIFLQGLRKLGNTNKYKFFSELLLIRHGTQVQILYGKEQKTHKSQDL